MGKVFVRSCVRSHVRLSMSTRVFDIKSGNVQNNYPQFREKEKDKKNKIMKVIKNIKCHLLHFFHTFFFTFYIKNALILVISK